MLLLALLGCGQPEPAPSIHGCTSWVDRKAPNADRRIGFGTALESSAVGYAPACMQIAAGESVTFVGDFGTHPLAPGEYAGDGGTAPNPIPSRTSGSSDLAVTFDRPGLYPYFCTLHAPTMVGAIWVK